MSRLESSQPDEWSQEPKSQSLGVSELDEFKKTVGEDWNVPLAFVIILSDIQFNKPKKCCYW